MQYFEKLQIITEALARAFPEEETPYQIITRLVEECGELAEQVHIFERRGVKPEKHGEPDVAKMTKEIQDVMVCALQMAVHYDLMAALEESIDRRLAAWCEKGTVTEEDLARYRISMKTATN